MTYSSVEVPNARWHEAHTFTCFAFSTCSEVDMEQIAEDLCKVIKSYLNNGGDGSRTSSRNGASIALSGAGTELEIHSLSFANKMPVKILLIEPEKGSILDQTFHERNVNAA